MYSLMYVDHMCTTSHCVQAHGRVVAQGTPQDLKSQFGEGYTITLVTPSTGNATDPHVLGMVQEYVPHAVMLGRQGAQLSFRLPR